MVYLDARDFFPMTQIKDVLLVVHVGGFNVEFEIFNAMCANSRWRRRVESKHWMNFGQVGNPADFDDY